MAMDGHEKINGDVKLIIMDLDGTLLGKQGFIPEENIRVLKKARDRGIGVTIASGRMHRTVISAAEAIGVTIPLVTYNGAMIREPRTDGRILFQKNLEEESVREILARLAPLGPHIQAYLTDDLYVEHDNELIQYYSREKSVPYTVVDSFLDLPSLEMTKFLIIEKRYGMMDRVREELAGISGIETELSSRSYCEVIAQGINKGAGLRRLCDHLGITPENVIAFGDQENDISMLKTAGLGIAMGNAPDKVKQAAGYVTDHCDEAGVARALLKWIPPLGD